VLIAGVVCPNPPLLIPQALGAAADDPPAELRRVADAAALAVAGLLVARPDLIAVVGGAPADHEYGAEASGDLRGFGVRAAVGAGEPVLPLSLTVGRWLLERAGVLGSVGSDRGSGGPVRSSGGAVRGSGGSVRGSGGSGGAVRGPAEPAVTFRAVSQRAPAADCLRLGAGIAGRAPRVALLAMGDASARRARAAPEVPDPRAEEYDEDVAEALAAADARWLARLDPALDDELVVAGRAAWQVLAGAANGQRLHGRLHCMAAPYGVTYLVASWGEPGTG